MQKQCFKCNLVKSLEDFYKHPQMLDGRVNKCKECNKKENKKNWWKRRDEKREYDIKRHRYSIKRIFDHRFYGMVHRCERIPKGRRVYKVFGSKHLSKEQFIEWCYETKNYSKFLDIYNSWVKSDFIESLSPSIDRIDSKKSYVVGNLQWLTKSENCKKYNK